MARPSKLTPAQWGEVASRLAKGEKAADLAREFGVSKAAVSKQVSKRTDTIRQVAEQVVAADTAFRSLPIADQFIASGIIDDLKAISSHLASAAKYGAASAHRLSMLANQKLETVDAVDPMKSVDELRTVGALTELANKASTIPLNLLSANKKTVERINDTPPADDVSIDAYLEARKRVIEEF